MIDVLDEAGFVFEGYFEWEFVVGVESGVKVSYYYAASSAAVHDS